MTSDTIATLDTQFRVGDQVRVVNRAGHTIIVANTMTAQLEIALQGAQLLSWQPKGQPDLLWCAPLPPAGTGKAIRGGVPICWPWFGPHASDPAQPQHGLVRTVDWQLSHTAVTPAGVLIALTHDAWGCALRLDVEASSSLQLTLTTRNVGQQPVSITEALHTYFSVSDVGGIGIHGLDGCRFRDNTDGGAEKLQHGVCRTDKETIAVFDQAPDICEIDDPGLKRRIRIARRGGQSTVVWHPGASVAGFKDIPASTDRQFVCVESGNVGASTVTIAPGATHKLGVTYDLLPICWSASG